MDTNSTPPHNCWPCLVYADAPAAITFLTEAFGFERRLVVEGHEGREIAHAELAWPTGGGIMLGTRIDDEADTFGRPPNGTGFTYCTTDDPDALYARAVAAGSTVETPLQDFDHGSRGFTARDPEGNLWSFGTWRGVPEGTGEET